MSEEQRLEQKIKFRQERWQRLSDDIASLQATYDRETCPEEKIRLKPAIDKKEAERREVDTELALLESEWHRYANQKKKTDLIQDAHRLERNQAYLEAIETWEKISEIDPDDPKIANEMRRLNNKQQQLQRINDYIKQLTSKLPKLKPSLFGQIITTLRQPEGISEPALGLIDVFVTGMLSAKDFIEAWQELSANISSPSTEKPNYPVIADRVARGDIALFLGSDISPLFTDSVPKDVAKELARKVNYAEFVGSLATIGEYYQISDYGRSRLVNDLRDLIYSPDLSIPLYQKLGQIEQPLVLVSAAYDTLLENAFSQSGKKYILISSIIDTTAAYDVGNVLIQYSDKPELTALLGRVCKL
jgi:tetratricopeptide (TPR) repeat protein